MNYQDITVEELIERINDNIDIYTYPHSQIHEIDDDKSWDNLGSYVGGSMLVQLLCKGIPERANWWIYNEDANEIVWFSSKQAILNAFGYVLDELYLDE